jgi:hypothetical protein
VKSFDRPSRLRRLAFVVVASLLVAGAAAACNDPATPRPAGWIAPTIATAERLA